MGLIDNKGIVYLNDSDGKAVEVARMKFGEYFDPIEATTPEITYIEIDNPVQFVTDVFYFKKDEEGMVFNCLRTDETTMRLLEIYMTNIQDEHCTPEQLLTNVIQKFFVELKGYQIPDVVFAKYER